MARRSSGSDSGCGCFLAAVVAWMIIVQGLLERVTKFLGISTHSDWPFYVVFFGVPGALVVLWFLLLLAEAVQKVQNTPRNLPNQPPPDNTDRSRQER